MTDTVKPHAVYKAICEATAELAKEGITKDRTADAGSSGKYKFRGIDDVYNALAPILAKVGLVIIPRFLHREYYERDKASGSGKLCMVVVEAEFDFVAVADGSKHTARTFGEAMDSGDKATNKAMSAAYKYAAFQTFSIPTEGDNDTENHTHEVKPLSATPPTTPNAPEPTSTDVDVAIAKMDGCATVAELNALYKTFPPKLADMVKSAATARKQAILAGGAA